VHAACGGLLPPCRDPRLIHSPRRTFDTIFESIDATSMLVRAKLIHAAWNMPRVPPPFNLLGLPARGINALLHVDYGALWERYGRRHHSRRHSHSGRHFSRGPTAYWRLHVEQVEEGETYMDAAAALARTTPSDAEDARILRKQRMQSWAKFRSDARSWRTMSAARTDSSSRGKTDFVTTPHRDDETVQRLVAFVEERAPDTDAGERWRNVFNRRLTGMERRLARALEMQTRGLAQVVQANTRTMEHLATLAERLPPVTSAPGAASFDVSSIAHTLSSDGDHDSHDDVNDVAVYAEHTRM